MGPRHLFPSLPSFFCPPPRARGGLPHSAHYSLGEESPRDKGKEEEGRTAKAETKRKELGMGDGTPQPPTPPRETHRGAEGGHPPVLGGNGEVIEGDVLAVQLSILPHPQLPFHRGDHKLPCRRQRGPGSRSAAANGPAPQGNVLFRSRGTGTTVGLGTKPCPITADTGGLWQPGTILDAPPGTSRSRGWAEWPNKRCPHPLAGPF